MKFGMDDLEKYSPEGNTNYFSLKNDGDKAQVRIMYENINDVEGHCVHKVKQKNGQFTYVECLRNYEDPIDCCPLCASKVNGDSKLMSRIWVPMYITEESRAVLWERGKSFWKDQLYPLMVEKGEPFCAHVFTVERHGAAGDIETTYELIDEGADHITLDDFDEIPDPVGTIIQEKTFEELERFVRTRSFDDNDSAVPEAPDFPPRRRGTDSNIPTRRGTRPNIV